MGDRFDKLTEGQRECLRLIYMRWQLREIAGQLNISVGAVNQRLRLARQTLGVASSIEAARQLAAHEKLPADYISPISPRNTVAPEPDDDLAPISIEHGEAFSGWSSGQEVREVQAAYQAALPPHGRWGWPLPSDEGATNDLSFMQILFWVMVIALATGVAAFTVVALALSIHDTLSRF